MPASSLQYSQEEHPSDQAKTRIGFPDGHSFLRIFSDTFRDLYRVQSDAAAATFARNMESIVPLFAPVGPDYLLAQLPERGVSQSIHYLSTVSDTVSVIVRMQYQLFAWNLGCLVSPWINLSAQTAPVEP